MEPSGTPGAQPGVPTSSEEPFHLSPDYEDEFLRYLWRDYLYPKQYEWVLIAAYVAVFLIALVGNTLGRCLPSSENERESWAFPTHPFLWVRSGRGLIIPAEPEWVWPC